MKRGVGLMIVVLALVLLGFGVSRRGGPPTVRVILPRRQDVTRTLAVTGQVEAIHSAGISSAIAGIQVLRVLVDKGDRVREGQPLIELDDRELRAAAARAVAQARQSEANLLRARAQALGAGRSVTLARQAVEDNTDLKNQRDQAAATLKGARERLNQAREAATRTREGARRQAVRAAQAQLRQAQAQQRLTEVNLHRSENLARQGATSQADLDLARTNYENAVEAVNAAQEQVTQLAEPRTEDVRQADAAVREAEAALTGAQMGLRNAERAYANRTAANQALTVAQTDRDAAQAAIAAAEADLMQARANADQARATLTKTVLRAPVTGVVTDRKVEPGEIVSAGQTLLSVAAPRSLRIRADVDETNLHLLRVGQRAIMVPDAYPSLHLEGTLSEIIPSGNTERGTVEIRIALTKPEPRLLPQLTIDINLVTGRFLGALTLPRTAVLDPESAPRVRVVAASKVEERKIEVTAGEVGEVVVLSGLSVGDTVLADPAAAQAGRRVQPQLIAEGRP